MKNFDATSKKFSWPYPSGHRLLHSPSVVAVGLSVSILKTWPQIGWHHSFVIGWSKDRLGLPSAPLHYRLKWPMGIPTVFQTPLTVPLHCNCLPLGLCKGTVKESTVVSHGRLLHNSLNRYHAEFLAATKQLYDWFSPSVRPSVCPSVCLSVRLSHLFHHVPIIVSS